MELVHRINFVCCYFCCNYYYHLLFYLRTPNRTNHNLWFMAYCHHCLFMATIFLFYVFINTMMKLYKSIAQFKNWNLIYIWCALTYSFVCPYSSHYVEFYVYLYPALKINYYMHYCPKKYLVLLLFEFYKKCIIIYSYVSSGIASSIHHYCNKIHLCVIGSLVH